MVFNIYKQQTTGGHQMKTLLTILTAALFFSGTVHAEDKMAPEKAKVEQKVKAVKADRKQLKSDKKDLKVAKKDLKKKRHQKHAHKATAIAPAVTK
jgi:hypothetical protein